MQENATEIFMKLCVCNIVPNMTRKQMQIFRQQIYVHIWKIQLYTMRFQY